MDCVFASASSQEAANFGNFATGIAALLSIVALIIGAMVELPKWRKRSLLQKQSEVAGRVSEAMLRAFQALELIASPVIDSPTDPAEEAGPHRGTYQQRRDQTNRRTAVSKDIEKFILVSNEAKIFLSDKVNAKLDDLWKLWVSTKVDIDMSLNILDQSKGQHDTSFHENSYGTRGRHRRKTLQEELIKMLRPVVRME